MVNSIIIGGVTCLDTLIHAYFCDITNDGCKLATIFHAHVMIVYSTSYDILAFGANRCGVFKSILIEFAFFYTGTIFVLQWLFFRAIIFALSEIVYETVNWTFAYTDPDLIVNHEIT